MAKDINETCGSWQMLNLPVLRNVKLLPGESTSADLNAKSMDEHDPPSKHQEGGKISKQRKIRTKQVVEKIKKQEAKENKDDRNEEQEASTKTNDGKEPQFAEVKADSAVDEQREIIVEYVREAIEAGGTNFTVDVDEPTRNNRSSVVDNEDCLTKLVKEETALSEKMFSSTAEKDVSANSAVGAKTQKTSPAKKEDEAIVREDDIADCTIEIGSKQNPTAIISEIKEKVVEPQPDELNKAKVKKGKISKNGLQIKRVRFTRPLVSGYAPLEPFAKKKPLPQNRDLVLKSILKKSKYGIIP